MKRAAAVASLLLLSACASGGDLPSLRYLEASAQGVTPPRVDEAEYRRAADLWADTVVDAGACRLPPDQVLSAAFAARAELAAMGDYAEGRTGNIIGDVLGRLVTSGFGNRPLPPRARCARIARWLPQVQARREQAGDWSILERMLRGL